MNRATANAKSSAGRWWFGPPKSVNLYKIPKANKSMHPHRTLSRTDDKHETYQPVHASVHIGGL